MEGGAPASTTHYFFRYVSSSLGLSSISGSESSGSFPRLLISRDWKGKRGRSKGRGRRERGGAGRHQDLGGRKGGVGDGGGRRDDGGRRGMTKGERKTEDVPVEHRRADTGLSFGTVPGPPETQSPKPTRGASRRLPKSKSASLPVECSRSHRLCQAPWLCWIPQVSITGVSAAGRQFGGPGAE